MIMFASLGLIELILSNEFLAGSLKKSRSVTHFLIYPSNDALISDSLICADHAVFLAVYR